MSKIMQSRLLEARRQRNRHRMMRKTKARRGLRNGHRVANLRAVQTVPLTVRGHRAFRSRWSEVPPDHRGCDSDADHQDDKNEDNRKMAAHDKDAMSDTPATERTPCGSREPRSGGHWPNYELAETRDLPTLDGEAKRSRH